MLHTEPIVIIVDDDAEDRELLIDVLRAAGVHNTIVQFDDGSVFLSAIGSTSLAGVRIVVTLDLDMPKMGGHEVLEALGMNPSAPLFPVIVLSDNCSMEAGIEHLQRLGAMGCYAKPSDVKDYRFIVAAIKYGITSGN